jgi:hypothetical protein
MFSMTTLSLKFEARGAWKAARFRAGRSIIETSLQAVDVILWDFARQARLGRIEFPIISRSSRATL